MRGTEAIRLKAWTLPVIVAALALPVVAAAILLGPPGAFAAGFLTAFTLAVIAIRARYDEEIEVAASPDDLYRALIVCLAPIEDEATAGRVAAEISSRAASFEGAGNSLALFPAQNRALSEWLSDVDKARSEARRGRDISVAHLQALGVEVSGEVGEADVVQTVEDTLRSFPARDVLVVTSDAGSFATEIEDLRLRLDRPVLRL